MQLMTAPPKLDKFAFDRLTRARAGMILHQPFFGALALRMPLVEDRGIKTLSVNGKIVKYNPDFVRELDPNVVTSAIAHEVGHCVYNHIHRRGARHPEKWNRACDYTVNEMLKDAGFQLGKGWLYEPAFKGMSADHIYNLLPDEPDGPGNGPGDGGALCEVEQDGHDEAETAQDEREWKVATIQAANAAKAAGALPGSLQRFIDELTTVKVDWRELLRRFITQTNDTDYTWSRPNRRMLAHGYYLPRLYSEQMGEVVVVVDCSGSVDEPTLNAFGTEIKAIVEDLRPSNTTVIYCDAAVNHVDEYGPDDDIKLVAHGGGGTHFAPPFDWLDARGHEPVCLVYLTDLIGGFGLEAAFPVLWVCTTKRVAPWGETVPIEI